MYYMIFNGYQHWIYSIWSLQPKWMTRRDMHEIFKCWTWDFGLDLGKRAGLGWK